MIFALSINSDLWSSFLSNTTTRLLIPLSLFFEQCCNIENQICYSTRIWFKCRSYNDFNRYTSKPYSLGSFRIQVDRENSFYSIVSDSRNHCSGQDFSYFFCNCLLDLEAINWSIRFANKIDVYADITGNASICKFSDRTQLIQNES